MDNTATSITTGSMSRQLAAWQRMKELSVPVSSGVPLVTTPSAVQKQVVGSSRAMPRCQPKRGGSVSGIQSRAFNVSSHSVSPIIRSSVAGSVNGYGSEINASNMVTSIIFDVDPSKDTSPFIASSNTQEASTSNEAHEWQAVNISAKGYCACCKTRYKSGVANHLKEPAHIKVVSVSLIAPLIYNYLYIYKRLC
jgi:hypothetical protein